MLALLTKGLRSTKPTSLPSCLSPQYRLPFSNQTARLANKSYSKPGSERPNKDVLQKFKKIAALRRDFESRDGIEIINHAFRHALRMRMQGVDYYTAKVNGKKVHQLYQESLELVRDLSEIESRYRTLDHRQQLRLVSKWEALLEADAAQPRPVLRIQERLAVKDVLKAFLKIDKLSGRVAMITTLVLVGLLGKSLHWLWKRFYRTPVDNSDFSKIHKPDPGVE